MPVRLVREAAVEHRGDVERLAGRFDVSRQAMQTRLRRLGLGGQRV